MPEITVLSQETIDKIAAGEVVERPSSVVKELVENAIDARATAVTAEIREGGISFIRITDNGCGIARPQVPIAFLRHSTSKIKSVEDLFHVTSLGFRGEALSSIAAVAQVELITRTYGELTGTRYVIEGSREKENEEIGAPDGTTFIVRNLFYNTPARRKFLKTAQTEGNYVNDLMERLALSHPDVSFKFINNGQTKLHTSGNSSEKDLIYHIYGRDITSSLLPLDVETDFFSVKGFIGKPSVSRGNRNFENYFINGRYIKSSLLSKAVEEAYKGFLMQRQYPFCVLYLDMDKELLDVNVHPAKMELRFSHSEEIFRELCRLIRDALTRRELIPEVPVKEKKGEKRPVVKASIPEPFEKKRLDDIRSAVAGDSPYQKKYPQREGAGTRQPEPGESKRFFDRLMPRREEKERTEAENQKDMRQKPQGKPEVSQKTEIQAAGAESAAADATGQDEMYMAEQAPDTGRAASFVAEQTMPSPQIYDQQTFLTRENGFLTENAVRKHKVIGQLFDTYWLVEYEDRLFVIDQHAAHEKVLYEKMMARLRKKEFTSQAVSPPVILTLSVKEQETLERYGEQIRMSGYEIEPFGGKEYAIKAVPAEFDAVDKKSMFLELLDDFSGLGGKDAPEQILEKTASMSCKAAVKGSQRLNRAEMEELITELLSLDNPYHCPHGRPTIISMSRYEIEKKFKRIV